jgi:hypothetical protein
MLRHPVKYQEWIFLERNGVCRLELEPGDAIMVKDCAGRRERVLPICLSAGDGNTHRWSQSLVTCFVPRGLDFTCTSTTSLANACVIDLELLEEIAPCDGGG